MLPPLVKYEYDRITLSDEGMDQDKLDALLRFNEYHGNQYFDGIAKGICLKQYVGIIQVDGLTIEVLPKTDRHHDEATWREVLIGMLKATGRLKVQTTGNANVKRQHLNLLEIYLEMYLKELQYLIRSGLVKKYRRHTGNVKALRGKLEFAGNIQRNLIHKERFYTTHQVYDVDHTIHQVLFVALDIVYQFARGTRLNDHCRRVQLDFPEVKTIQVNEQMLSGIQLNRKTSGYDRALEIARLIILNYSPDIKSGKEKMLSLLFDMNVLWEEYVLTMLRKECRGTNIHVRGQEKKRFWGSYKSLRPDIVLEREGETFIIDTKWKRPLNHQPSVEDLRQMYTYARFWDADRVMLLYPGSKEGSFEDFLTDEHYPDGGGVIQIRHRCKMGFVSVLDPNSKEPKLDDKTGERILRTFGLIENEE